MSNSFAQCAAMADVNKMALAKADAAPVQVVARSGLLSSLGARSELAG
jgi:hypothetical protein